MPYIPFESEEHISVEEFLGLCSKSEIKEVKEWLSTNGHSALYTPNGLTVSETDVVLALNRIEKALCSLTPEQTEQILKIARTVV